MSGAAQGSRQAERAAEMLAGFVEGSPELREAAIFAPDGTQLFSTRDADRAELATRLWEAAGPIEAPLAQLHIGTGDGEVLAVRSAAGSAIAVSGRFPLASLVFSDLRAVLRELGPGPGAA